MKRIFDQTQIGSMVLKNRVIRTAVGDHGTDAQGHLGDKDFEGYERLAKGGVSTIITGYSWVCDYPMGGRAKMLGAYDDSFLPEYRKLAELVHAHGCNIVQQLAHIGGATACEDVEVIAPSAVPGPYNGQVGREMDAKDIERVQRAFIDAVLRSKEAGFDGVEIHAAHRFLLSQFLSPVYNKRTDGYGGSDENRARFAVETCQRVRDAVGADYPVLFKVNCDDGEEGGITLEGFLTACRMLEEAGASAIEVSGAWMNYKQDSPYFLSQTVAAANLVGIPVILVGGVRGKETAERVLAETPIRYIGMARLFNTNPELLKAWNKED